MTAIRIRCSSAPRIAACPRRHNWERENRASPAADAVHVGLHVGALTHRAITGHETAQDAPGQPPPKIAYDTDTPTSQAVERAVRLGKQRFDQWLAKSGLEIAYREVAMEADFRAGETTVRLAGHADLILKDEAGRLHLLDIKTGQAAPGAILQTCLYALLWQHHIEGDGKPPYTSGYLLIPRRADRPINTHFVPGDISVKYGLQYIREYTWRVESGLDDQPLPGFHCAMCRVPPTECIYREQS